MIKDGRRDYGTLTPEILRHLNMGMSTKAIADALDSSTETVRAIAYRNGYTFDGQRWVASA